MDIIISTKIKSLYDFLQEEYSNDKYKLSTIVLGVLLMLSLVIQSPAKTCSEDNEDSILIIYIFRLGFLAAAFVFGIKSFTFLKKEITLKYETQERTGEDFNLSEYFLYRLDYLYSHDRQFKPIALMISTLVLITLSGFLWYFSTNDTLGESMWYSWTFVSDPGTHSDNKGILKRLVSLITTLGGMVIFAFVIGVVNEDMSTMMENLRKGKSRVVEANHTLILGQGDKLIPTIQQICLANESEGGGTIVILTELPKQEVEEQIHASEIDLLGKDVVVRTGMPHLQSDLKKVSAVGARSVVILADRSSQPDMNDVNAVRTVLSLKGIGAPANGHIVCEVSDVDNENLVAIVGESAVETFVSHDVIGRLMIQCARERGLAQVLEALLGFEGCEFYIQEWPELAGLTFGELLYRFKDAVTIGIMRAKEKPSDLPQILLNPSVDTLLNDGDAVVVIAEDNDSYSPSTESFHVNPKRITRLTKKYIKPILEPEKMLFIGWRRDVDDMVLELDSYVAPGSELMMFSQLDVNKREMRLKDGGLTVDMLKNLKLSHVQGNQTNRKDLESLPLQDYDSILILADEDYEENEPDFNIMAADSRSLTCLLLIRDIQSTRSAFGTSPRCTVISEILDPRTKPLISVASVTDYVTSNELISMAIAMVAEQREVNAILKEILSSDGNELYLRPADVYVADGTEASFYELVHIAKAVDHLVIGYKKNGKLVINPEDKLELITWTSDVDLIIFAEDIY